MTEKPRVRLKVLLMTSRALLPANPSFAGHQTFSMRSGWLKKGIDAFYNTPEGGGSVFTRDDAIVTLGVGKNMVQSIRHWLLVTGMANETPTARGRDMSPTAVGNALFGIPENGWDPFLEDVATLWLIHWQLASAAGLAYSWIYAFNLFREVEFSKETLIENILNSTSRVSKPPSRETVGRDVECLLHTYVASQSHASSEDNLECPLQDLGLIQPRFDRHYRFSIGPKPSLPIDIFCFALASYWKWKEAESTLSVRDITYSEGSPGTVFKLDEDSVLSLLEDLEAVTEGLFRFDDTTLVRQVICEQYNRLDPLSFLQRHYHA